MKRFLHLDADESAFFQRSLNYVMARTYDIKYVNLKARTLIPLNTAINPGAETITYEQYDQVGMAKIVSSYADDIPRVDIKGKEFVGRIRSLADGYGYSLQEIRAARMNGVPLEQRKAAAAKRAMATLENKIAFKGDADYGLRGLLNHPNISEYTLPADGTGSSKTFASKTPDKVLRDINALVNFIVESTSEVEIPDTLLLPTATFNYLNSTPWSTANDGKTLMKLFMENQTYIKNVESVSELNTAGAGGTKRMVAYRRDPEVLQMHVPQDFEQLDVEQRNLEFTVACHQRFGGVSVYYPLAVCFADGL